MFRNPLRNLKIPPFTRIGKLETWVQIQGILLKKVSFQKFCCAACSPRGIFFKIFFYKKGRKRAFPTHFEAVNASKDHPTRQSHLREPMHGDMGFMCYLNIHFIAQIQLFSLPLFRSKVGPSKHQTLSRKHLLTFLTCLGE